jgi:hypothetical protein
VTGRRVGRLAHAIRPFGPRAGTGTRVPVLVPAVLDPSGPGWSSRVQAALLNRFDGEVFHAEAAALTRVGEAVRQRDAPRLREETHRLRGLLSTFSATTAAEAERPKSMGASGQPDEAAWAS